MRKIITSIALLLAVFSTSFAATGEVQTQGLTQSVEATNYIYYWGQGCSHCAKVDAYLDKVDGVEKLGIDKREVYFNEENRVLFGADTERLGLDGNQGVPFLIIENGEDVSYINGDKPIIEYFTPILGEAPESKRKYIAYVILIFIAVAVPVGLIFGNKK